MSLFYILQTLLNYSIFIISGCVCFLITELCLRLTFQNKKKPQTFWKSSFIIAVCALVTFSSIFSYIIYLDSKTTTYAPYDHPLIMLLLYLTVPVAIGLVLGYLVAMRFDTKITAKTHTPIALVINFFTTLILTIFSGIITSIMLFILVSDVGSHIIRSTYGTFHYFNQHVRGLCQSGSCAKNEDEIRAFDPKRYQYLDLMTEIQYKYDPSSQNYYFSVSFNPHRVLSSTINSDMLSNTEEEARAKGLWE